jgi:hypothetical protein
VAVPAWDRGLDAIVADLPALLALMPIGPSAWTR